MRFARKYNSEPFEVTCLRCREDPLPQTPYGRLRRTPIHSMPSEGFVLRSVCHAASCGQRRELCSHGIQLVLRFRCRRHLFRTGSPDPRQHPFGSGHSSRIRPVIRDGRRRCRPYCPGFLPPFSRRHLLLGSSIARQGTGPSSRSAYRTQPRVRTLTGLPRSTRTSYDRGGCLLYPGDGGAPPGRPQIPDRRLPLLNGQSLYPARPTHQRGCI